MELSQLMRKRLTMRPAFGSNLAIESEKVTIKGAENMNVYEDYDTSSGKCVRRHFCKTCGKWVYPFIFQFMPPDIYSLKLREIINKIHSPIQSIAEAYPGKTILKMGIFEKVMTPEWESFVKDRHPWLPAVEGAVQFKSESGGEKV